MTKPVHIIHLIPPPPLLVDEHGERGDSSSGAGRVEQCHDGVRQRAKPLRYAFLVSG